MNVLQRALKRSLDVAVTLAAAPLAISIVGAMAIAIRLESEGHPIFEQTRVGRGGRLFTVYKLRTMVENAENIGAGLYYEPGDSRFTRVGLFARRFSLDEVPQLFNVLRGDMSIVGPRPMLPVTIEEYPAEYATILEVKPGLTGLAQVNGRNALTRSQRLAYDMEYARGATVIGDIQILLRTFGVVATGEGQLMDQGREDVEK